MKHFLMTVLAVVCITVVSLVALPTPSAHALGLDLDCLGTGVVIFSLD